MSHSGDYQRLAAACRLIASGRSLARQLATAVRRFDLNETEFRLLWLLRERSASGDTASVDQRVLANSLALSPAQVSATVEKLRTRQILEPIADRNDRRRQLWRFTTEGKTRFELVCETALRLSSDWDVPSELECTPMTSTQEDAA